MIPRLSLAFLLVCSAASSARAWSDDPLQPGKTPVRASHVAELRAHIDAKRRTCSLKPHTWTTAAAAGQPIGADAFNELRGAANQLLSDLGQPPATWTPPPALDANSTIRAVYLSELRAAVDRASGAPCPPPPACIAVGQACGAGPATCCAPNTCSSGVCTAPAGCTCTDWADGGACGTNGCGGSDKPFKRTCTPAGCQPDLKCQSDASCGACVASGGDCSSGPCCAGLVCGATERCGPMPCDPVFGTWANAGCGQNGCPGNQQAQTKTDVTCPGFVKQTSNRCVDDATCGPQCPSACEPDLGNSDVLEGGPFCSEPVCMAAKPGGSGGVGWYCSKEGGQGVPCYYLRCPAGQPNCNPRTPICLPDGAKCGPAAQGAPGAGAVCPGNEACARCCSGTSHCAGDPESAVFNVCGP